MPTDLNHQLLKFSDTDVCPDPYPHFCIDSAIDTVLFENMKADWPVESMWDNLPEKMGGRSSFARRSKKLRSFLTTSESWRTFFEYVNSEPFVRRTIDVYRPFLQQWECKVDPDTLPFTPLPPEEDDKITLNVDHGFTRAKNGYFNPVHHDIGYRFAVVILFINDRSSFGGQGGTFDIHRLTVDTPLAGSVRLPVDNLELVKSFEPKQNRMICFLNTRQAYHSVPILSGATGYRNFIYLGINVGGKRSRIW